MSIVKTVVMKGVVMKNEARFMNKNWSNVTFTVISKQGANWVLSLKARRIAFNLGIPDGTFGSCKPQHRDHLILEGRFSMIQIYRACNITNITVMHVVGDKNKSMPFEPRICKLHRRYTPTRK